MHPFPITAYPNSLQSSGTSLWKRSASGILHDAGILQAIYKPLFTLSDKEAQDRYLPMIMHILTGGPYNL